MAKQQINYQELSNSIVVEHNNVRRDPKSYIPILEKYITYFKGTIIYKPNEIPIQTNEGVKAYEDAIQFLKEQAPVSDFLFEERLSKSCLDHVNDVGPKGMISHESSDGKTVTDRIEKFAEWDGACAENIDFGSKTGVDVVVGIIVDDGVPNKGHRRNLFSPDLKIMGVSSGLHKDYDVISVIDYVGGLRELNKPFFDYKNFKYQYPDNLNQKKREKGQNKSFPAR